MLFVAILLHQKRFKVKIELQVLAREAHISQSIKVSEAATHQSIYKASRAPLICFE